MIRKEENKFIVYRHINSLNGIVFYIGIGLLGREKQKYKRSERWKNYVNKYGFTYEILHTKLNWTEACEIEKRLIIEYGRCDLNTGNLINMTNGGDGAAGYEGFWKGKKRPPVSDLTRKKLSENNPRYWLGKSISEETKEKLKTMNTGKKWSEQQKSNLNGRPVWNKGKKGEYGTSKKGKKLPPLSQDHKDKISNSNTGKTRSDEFKKQNSVRHKGKILSMETREKIRQTLLKRKVSL